MAAMAAGLFHFPASGSERLVAWSWEPSQQEESVKKSSTGNASHELRLELKYCERCGSLCLRECGRGQIYCDRCLPVVAELPAPQRERTSPQLPVAPRAFIDDDEIVSRDMDDFDLHSAGGAA
jgi:hypothetical protein